MVELLRTEADRQALTEAAPHSLHAFVRAAWDTVEPDIAFVDGWHIRAICTHLEAVVRGDIKNLRINVPPGHMKSLLCSVFLPAWAWITKPGLCWVFASYDQALSTRDSIKCRAIISSPWYQENWGEVFQFTGDQNQKTRFDNNRRGWRIATSIGGRGTGEHPDFVVADDPNNVRQADSEAGRQQALDWWQGTISTRGITRDSRRVVIMQRLHQEDLSGYLEGRKGWDVICLPMRYEPDRMQPTSLGWTDERTETGEEFLWPELFDEEKVATLEIDLNYRAAGQLQQRPAPAGGGMFKREWFEIVQVAPIHASRCRYWDKAGTDDGGDWTVGLRMARTVEGECFIEDVVRAQLSAGARNKLMLQTAEIDARLFNNQVVQVAEQEGGSGGKDSALETVRLLSKFPVYRETVTGKKTTRALPVAAQSEAGNVKLVAGDWIQEFLDELTVFPNGKHDDQVDGLSGAYNRLAKGVVNYGDHAMVGTGGPDDIGIDGVLTEEEMEGMEPYMREICDDMASRSKSHWEEEEDYD